METSTIPGVAVILLTLACVVVVYAGLRKILSRSSWSGERQQKALRKSIVLIAAWIILIGMMALLGFFRVTSTTPPRPVLLIIGALIGSIALAFSKPVSELLRVTPLHWLIYIQSFRILVELILWQGYERGLLPVQMTFEGYNFDIISGLLAIPAGWLMARSKSSAVTIGFLFNIIGIILLLNILTIAVLSMPTPLRYFMNEPSNIIVGEFPFIYIPAVFVVLAIFMHVFSLRQLLLVRRTTAK